MPDFLPIGTILYHLTKRKAGERITKILILSSSADDSAAPVRDALAARGIECLVADPLEFVKSPDKGSENVLKRTGRKIRIGLKKESDLLRASGESFANLSDRAYAEALGEFAENGEFDGIVAAGLQATEIGRAHV